MPRLRPRMGGGAICRDGPTTDIAMREPNRNGPSRIVLRQTKSFGLCIHDAEPRFDSGYRFDCVCSTLSDLKKHLFETAGCYRGEHLTRFVANVAKAMRYIGRQHNNRSRVSVKLVITAPEAIDTAYYPKNFRFTRVRMIVRAFAGWSKCFPHPQGSAGFFCRCMNDNVAPKRGRGDPFLTGPRHYCFTEISHAASLLYLRCFLT